MGLIKIGGRSGSLKIDELLIARNGRVSNRSRPSRSRAAAAVSGSAIRSDTSQTWGAAINTFDPVVCAGVSVTDSAACPKRDGVNSTRNGGRDTWPGFIFEPI